MTGIKAAEWRAGVWTVRILERRGRSEITDFIDGLPIPVQKKVVKLVERVAASPDGPFGLHNAEKFKRLEENLYELKAAQVRLLFFIEGKRIIIVTNSFLKKTKKIPDAEIRRARTLRALYQQEHQQ